MTDKVLKEWTPTDEQLKCKHELLKRCLSSRGICYRCNDCELIFDEPDVRFPR